MEERVYAWVCGLIDDLEEPSTRVVYPLRQIVRMALWSIIHDRPLYWACVAENWPANLCPRDLPNQSTLSRRINHLQMNRAMQVLHDRILHELGIRSPYAAIDARSLHVGGSSQDRDARGGRAVGGMWRGYKLYAAADLRQAFLAFEVHAMNHAEQTVAQSLVKRLPPTVRRVVGDTIYDSMPLHHAAAACGRKLYSPLRQHRVGRRQQRRRLQLLRLWRRRVGKRLLRSRDTIERAFARLSGIGFGFKGLPPWARGLSRVRLWISGKILLYNAYLAIKTPQHDKTIHA